MRLIQTDEEEINSEDNDFIEDLKEFSIQQEERYFIVFDKKDITLKIDIDEVNMKTSEQEICSKVDAKINDKIMSNNIICMLENTPNYLGIRLEADYFDHIIELMKCEIFIKKLEEQGIKFVYKDTEIEPRIIESKMDEDNLKNEVKEIERKRYRLNLDCDK